MKNRKKFEYLEYKFSDAEIRAISKDAGRVDQDMHNLENRLDQVKKSLAGEIAEKKAEFSKLLAKMTNGYEMRSIECEERFDTPEPGRVTLVRLDNDEVISIRRMTESESQLNLPLEEAPPPEPVIEMTVVEEPPVEEPPVEEPPVEEPPVEEPPVDDVAPEPPVEETTAEPEPTELRRLNHSLHGGTAEIVIFTDADGQIRRYATAAVKHDDVTLTYDSGTAGIYETSQEATKAAALDVWKWAKAVNDEAKPGMVKVASMAMVVFCSKVLEDLRQGKL